ncbi:MAG TPA: 4-hydroxy-tetrahydrodipicolinate synthase [Candidatus Paceibacterota bacterium]
MSTKYQFNKKKGKQMHVNNGTANGCGASHTITPGPFRFHGTFTALITPFTNSGEIDSESFQKQIERQIVGGVDGIVPCGTTGESPTLSFEEHIQVIDLAVKFADGRVRVLAGTGGNSTDEAIYLTEEAERVGADGSLQVTPYYNKPSQAGLFAHFSAIARKTALPIILYNVPSRCGVDIAADTVCRIIRENKNVVGIKVANGSLSYVRELRERCGPFFTILSGDDALTLKFITSGKANGIVSVVSNIFPDTVATLVRRARAGDVAGATPIHEELLPLIEAIFLEGNPVGVKSAMEQIGLDGGAVRLPLVEVCSQTAAAIRKALNGGLIHA